MTLTEIFMQPANIVIIGAAMSITEAFKRAFDGTSMAHLGARILPFVPLVLCVGLTFIPRESAQAMLWGDKLVLGLTLGMGTVWGHKTFGQSILGKDQRIADVVGTK